MEIPPEVLVATCLNQGTICHYKFETINNVGATYKGNRFFVILNANPKTDEILVLSTLTTKIDSQRRYIKTIGESPMTLVKITPADFPRLSQQSVINCNNIEELTKADLINKLKNKESKLFFERLPQDIINKIKAGVMSSKVVTQNQKELVL